MHRPISKPPPFAEWLLERSLSAEDRDHRLGDFEEVFQDIATSRGEGPANRWYWKQCALSMPGLIYNQFYWGTIMLTNYIKIALRNIARHKGFSGINIVGLATGMACCILILMWVQDELSYDRFHEKGDRIYRVLQDMQLDQNETWAITQGPLGPALKNDIPEIVDAARVTSRGFRLEFQEKRFDERVGFADPSLFDLFDFTLVKGDPSTALTDPRSMVISEAMVTKYFGREDPIGKTLMADDKYTFTVTGILQTIPKNSHLQMDFIIPFVFGRELNYSVDRWNNSQFTTYILLDQDASQPQVVEKIAHYLDTQPTLEEGTLLRLQPLADIHLTSNIEFESFAQGDIQYVYIFSIAAIFVLLIACINFINLTTAKSAQRALEVGLRKVVGAKRGDLIIQFFGESVCLAVIALLFAIGLVKILLPMFNDLSGKALTLGFDSSPLILLGIPGITLLTGILSALYPSLLLSSFSPIKTLMSKSASQTSGSFFRRVLVITQFSISLILIIGTIIIYQQISYMQDKKLGYDKEQLIYMRIRGGFETQYESVKNTLLQHPNIQQVTRTATLPSYGNVFSNSKWTWEGYNPEEEILMHGNFVGQDYFETFGMKITAGRGFSQAYSTTQDVVVLNETAVRRMGLTDPIGQQIEQSNDRMTIVGVVNDYHFRSLHNRIEPLVLILQPQYARLLCVRISGDNMEETIAYLEETWKEYAPSFPFNYGFLDEQLDRLYRTEQRTSTLALFFSGFSIFISCLGLIGLASYMAAQRTKEIGIRKVLGASIPNVMLLLSSEFVKLVLLANLLACPIAYLVMNNWLQAFYYRIEPGVITFVLAGTLTFLIALLTVGYQAIKTAKANPIDALRYE